MARLMFERVVELLIASFFAAGSILLGMFATDLNRAAYIDWLGDHLEISATIFVMLLFAYLTIFGFLVRYLVFLGRGDRKFCGLYAQIFFGHHDEPIVAPFLVLFNLLKNEFEITGHAFALDAEGDGILTHVAHWDSAVSHLDSRGSPAVEMSYIYSGSLTAQVDRIKGVSNLGLSEHSVSKPKARAGYICDLRIPAGDLGLIRDVDASLTAFRIVTVRFDDKHFRQFGSYIPNIRRRMLVSLFRIHRKVSEEAFESFLQAAGLQFLVGAELKGHASWVKAHSAIDAAAKKAGRLAMTKDAALPPTAPGGEKSRAHPAEVGKAGLADFKAVDAGESRPIGAGVATGGADEESETSDLRRQG